MHKRRHCSPGSSRAPLLGVRDRMCVSEVEALPFRVPRDFPHSRFSKAPLAVYPPKGARAKSCVSVPVVSLEKMACFGRGEGSQLKLGSSSSSTTASLSSHKSTEKLLNGRSATPPSLVQRRPSPSRSPLEKRPVPSAPPPSPASRQNQAGERSGKHRRVSGRVFDPNKHCGVLDPETSRPCTRSLTCKTHSLGHRRSVPGREKAFDVLLAEHKGRAREKEAELKKEACSQPVPLLQSHDSTASQSVSCSPGLKLRPSVVTGPPPLPPVEPEARPSSDEGEVDVLEDGDRTSCHFSSQHPRPLSCCGFSGRLLGRGHYVFDRRWDRARMALHCMLEKHLNALMWRKVPLAMESVSEASPLPSLHALDGVSVLSYSTSLSRNSSGVFCIRDPKPSSQQQRRKPAKLPKASGEGSGPKKRKAPPVSELGSSRGGGNSGSGYQCPLGAAHISNGTATPRPGGVLRGPDRYGGVEPSLPQAVTGDHGGVPSHSPLTYSSSDGRKRKSSGSSSSSRSSNKPTTLDGMFKKSGSGLLSSIVETAHSTTSRQSKVPH